MKRLPLFLLLLIALLVGSLSLAAGDLPAANNTLFDYELLVVRAFFDSPGMVAAVASWNEPWLLNRDEGYMILEVTPSQFDLLEMMGYRPEIDFKQTVQLNSPLENLPGQVSGIPGYPCYRTVEETFASAEDIVAQYPDLASWIDIGDSWEKTAPGGLDGYDMMVLKLTNSAVPGPKPKIFIMSAIHAREYTTAELNTRLAEYLVQNYGTDPDATWLLDHHEFHLLLQSNPDGRKHAETGESWRKNTNENYCSPTSSSRGADLNRNFSFQWACCGGSSGEPCATTYRGPSPASEPEVQAVQNYVTTIFPDQKPPDPADPAPVDATGFFIDIHSSGELVLWPWGYTATPAPNGTALQTLGRKMAWFNGYYPEQAIGLYPTDGTTDDFSYGTLGVAAYTFELGTSFFQSCGTFENTIVPDNLPALVYAAKAARTPYISSAGPDAVSVALDANPVEPGTPVQLTATVNDTRFSNQNGTEPTQNIIAAEYYIDVPPWITTTTPISYPMTPADGSFNSPIEAVEATVNTAALTSGRHTIYVRGQDATGTWGVVSAAFLFVIDPGVSPTIQGQVTAYDTGLPLEATITAGPFFQTQSDPVTGLYQMQVISGTYDLVVDPLSDTYAARTVQDVVAADYQIVTQDFDLYLICPVFEDDVEAGNLGWTPTGQWAITTESSHSPTHSWTDSPGANYPNYYNAAITSAPLDLTDIENITLDYWQTCDTESGYDYCYVEVSTDGLNWVQIASFDGPNVPWHEVSLDLPQLSYQPSAQIRFRLESDVSFTDVGWHVDDITISGGSAACGIEVAPTAAFSSTSPDPLGTPTAFTNLSTGTSLTFEWDFGDGSPISTESNPSHTYTGVGFYTVTLTATNSLGSDVATGQVEIVESELLDLFLPLIIGPEPQVLNRP